MTYQETVNWLFNQLPMYQNQGKSAYKEDLSNTILLANHLDNPESKFKSIHVAGTNGKGSTSHMLASVLQEAGYKVGLYTSPHLKDFRERIKINGNYIEESFVVDFITDNRSFFEANSLSFFEMTVGMAFQYFAQQSVDIAIIEVGLGGRLDSTNIITPEVSVITNIGLDHTQFLGTTLLAIAKEKAGIIKKGIPVVIGETQQETKPVFNAIANHLNSDILFADKQETITYATDLLGSYQLKNKQTAYYAIKALGSDFIVGDSAIEKGFSNVVANTDLLGRWQQLNDTPKVICDTAHNVEGLTYTMEQLSQEVYEELHIVFGVVSDKNMANVIALLPKTATYYLCEASISRAMPVSELETYFKDKDLKYSCYSSVSEAYKSSLSNASSKDFIYIGGSTFTVSEII